VDHSRVEAKPPRPFTKVEAVAHEDVINDFDMGYYEGFVVKSAFE
jgi:hypothetical protein